MSIVVPAVKVGRLRYPVVTYLQAQFIADDLLRISKACSDVFGVRLDLMYSRNRMGRVCLARQVAMYVMRERGCSSVLIGKHFRRDHATVLHAWTLVDRRVRSSKTFAIAVDVVEQRADLEALAA